MTARPGSALAGKGPRAIEILDEAVNLLRDAPLAVLSIYYLGALPFCLGLIYFWFDLTQSAEAEAHLPGESVILTLLYFWMKTCQAVFARKLLSRLEGEETEPWTLARWANTALLQAIYAGSFVVVYPVALLITLPFGFVSGFYHTISVIATGPTSTLRSSFKEAASLAALWPKQSHLILGIQLLAGFFLFLNTAVFFITIPGLLNTLFGIETIFDQNKYAWNNSSFYIDILIFCYLLINPLNKAVFALRIFYGQSRYSGADLKAGLRRHQALRLSTASALLMITLFLSGMAPAQTDPASIKPPPASPAVKTSAENLDRAIEKTLRQDDYTWRLPHPQVQQPEDNSLLGKALKSFYGFLDYLWKKISKPIGKFFKWLFQRHSHEQISTNNSWMSMADLPWRLIFLVLAIVILLIIGLLFLRSRRALPSATLTPLKSAPAPKIDLEAENVRADALPEDSWVALAQELLEKGELRLALRAFYLATLSVLAQHQLVRLSQGKTNRDYLNELSRRYRGNTPAFGYFRENIQLFEASWYGTHTVTDAMIQTVRTNHQQLRHHASI